MVMAKEPVAGRVKTRLCPPLDGHQAALVAEAALADTLAAVSRCGADRRVIALDGEPGQWLPDGFEILAQRGSGLAERLAGAWSDAAGPGLQIGMDTPQVTPALLDDALGRLDRPDRGRGRHAVLGPALDGGWWAIGFNRPAPAGAFSRVPMSTSGTGQAQADRLRRLGWEVEELATLRDVDTIDDLVAVAGMIPSSRTAAAAATATVRRPAGVAAK